MKYEESVPIKASIFREINGNFSDINNSRFIFFKIYNLHNKTLDLNAIEKSYFSRNYCLSTLEQHRTQNHASVLRCKTGQCASTVYVVKREQRAFGGQFRNNMKIIFF